MATWRKVCFYYDSIIGTPGSSLTATNTASGYDVNNLYDMVETTRWQAYDATSPQYITLDSNGGGGVSINTSADYLAVYGHNLGTTGSLIVLQYSADGTTWADAFTPFTVRLNKSFVKEFSSPGSRRYWRLKLTGQSVAPFMTICIWGKKTELDYASSSFDPHGQTVHANLNQSYGGAIAGIHTQYIERSFTFTFADQKSYPTTAPYLADGTYLANGSITGIGNTETAFYEIIKKWWDTVGLNNFFVGWDVANNPDDIFLIRFSGALNNPLKAGGLYRDINISLVGVKE